MSRSEMSIPKPTGEVIAAWVFTAFIVCFVTLSVSNLLNRVAILPSILLLLLVAAVVWAGCGEEGMRQFLINILGSFASKHFAESISGTKHPTEIRFGFRLLGHRYFYLTIPLDKIETVEWDTGQATDLAGHDMNDWHITIWFDHDDPSKSQKQQDWHRKPDQDVYIVGPHRRKEDAVAFGRSLLDFLRQAGASLVKGQDECSFVRKAPDTETDK
ncbi:MAG: hypothetical protein ACYTE5_00025 [Planctomycetota bacterium]